MTLTSLPRLEVGSGNNPRPGFIHLDVNADLPEVDIVGEMDAIPSPDNTFSEVWRPVVGYEGRYEVSNIGRVRSLLNNPKSRPRSPDGMLRQWPDNHGYPYVTVYLQRGGRCVGTKKKIHRLVAEAFIPNPNGLQQVNHIDGDKSNPHVSNLEWVNPKGNIAHAIRTGLRRDIRGEGNHKARITEEDALFIKRSKGHVSSRDISEQFGLALITVQQIRSGRLWKHLSSTQIS